MFETLKEYFINYSFVRYAMVAGLFIALCSSLLGVPLVLKRFSFIGDGLSHVAFGAIAISSVLNFALKQSAYSAERGSGGIAGFISNIIDSTGNMAIVLPFTIVAAVLLLKSGQNTKIKGDAAVAMISVSSLAVGYMLMNIFPTSSNISGDVCSTLFGSTSILTLTKTDVWICLVMAIAVTAVFIIFYNRIFSITFDENFSKATGVNVELYNLLIAVITAIVIVIAMNLVGSLLISALIIFPALSAMRIFRSFKGVIICSAVISVFCSAFGIVVSILFSTPVGSTIVVSDMAVFFIFSIISSCMGRSGK